MSEEGVRDHIAVARGEVIEYFARRVGARHLMYELDWRVRMMAAAAEARFSVDLDGVIVGGMLDRGGLYAEGRWFVDDGRRRPSALDWEVYLIVDSGALGRTDFYLGGDIIDSPFEVG